MCQKQDEEVRMSRLAENVGNHVAASLEMAIGRAMAPLTQSLDTFIKCATREQVDGVRRHRGPVRAADEHIAQRPDDSAGRHDERG